MRMSDLASLGFRGLRRVPPGIEFARTYLYTSGAERTKHKATAPPTCQPLLTE